MPQDKPSQDDLQDERDQAANNEDPQPSEEDVEGALEDAGAKPAREEDTDKLQRNTEVVNED